MTLRAAFLTLRRALGLAARPHPEPGHDDHAFRAVVRGRVMSWHPTPVVDRLHALDPDWMELVRVVDAAVWNPVPPGTPDGLTHAERAAAAAAAAGLAALAGAAFGLPSPGPFRRGFTDADRLEVVRRFVLWRSRVWVHGPPAARLAAGVA